ncbi:MAG TPA: alanine--tRNA ligase [Acidimicrobiales bacterium]|nr:alanine--tRNA ligase [Acidimicrobiales bacterium]
MDAESLRKVFTGYFVERGHTAVASAGLVPHHPRAPLFTNAGMNQFLPVFLGEEPPSYDRATSVQKCVRIMGKHDDIDNIGISTRHVTFFEMLGNFSFGDYFKSEAIPYAWELVTEGFGLDPARLWVTVHVDDDEAAGIWRDTVGLPAERIQRMGADNFWEMGETGPCGPCSEIFYDKGEAYGPPGGPAHGGEERFVEFWNLVFMQYDRQADGTLLDLPRRNIDTGLGFERTLCILQGVDSVFDTDVLKPLVDAAARITGHTYGADVRTDVSLRILADHARTMSFLVSDGVQPSNEGRGYVLRRIIRRAVRQAFQLGVEHPVTPAMVQAVVTVMGGAYPDLARNAAAVADIAAREESRFRETLRRGMAALDAALEGSTEVPGSVAFLLHDTFGFPIELIREIAAERGATVDETGFRSAMDEQRRRARASRGSAVAADAGGATYRELVDRFGTTEFVGYAHDESAAKVLAVLPVDDGTVEIFLDRTPFYAESGGQVGDTGTIVTTGGQALVLDTTAPLPGLHRHTARVVEGTVEAGQEAAATVDDARRDAIRRNHTGTHLLHWGLRDALGVHVQQQGSLVGPDYLRFDFSNPGPVDAAKLAQVEELVNEQILANDPVRTYETSKSHAEQLGAIAFFGDKYGEYVRVVEAGRRSMELCGGTHVGALGMIGPVKVLSESSIGSNLRRITAVTGTSTLQRIRDEERLLARAAALLRAEPDEVPSALERVLEHQKALEVELKALRSQAAAGDATALAAGAVGGIVVARRDRLTPDQLRQLALTVRSSPGIRAVALAGTPDGAKVGLVVAVAAGSGLEAPALVGEAARLVGGGGGGKGDVAMAGGRDPSRIDDALDALRSRLSS